MIIDTLTGGGKIIWSEETPLFLFKAGEDIEKFDKYLDDQYLSSITKMRYAPAEFRMGLINEWRSKL